MLDGLNPHDFPANPVEKPGYRLEFQDEFEGPALDSRKWLAAYLPHWTSPERAAPRYDFEAGHLTLLITAGQPAWCPEFDRAVRCSSIQTGAFSGPAGSPLGQHRFNPACRVRTPQPEVRLYTPQYGYFEMRARGTSSPANHVALWLIGFEDQPDRSGEIAVCEIMGAHVRPTSSQVGYGVHPWGDPALQDEFYEDFFNFDATYFHLYGLEWTPDHLDFFIDNEKIRTIHQSPHYPMQFMLSLYERPELEAPGDSTPPYPREFSIDYFRAYQPEAGY